MSRKEELSKRRAALSAGKRQLLADRLKQAKRHEIDEPAPSPLARPSQRKHPDRGPLSFAQQRLWFLDQLEPGDISYTISLFVRIKGTLDRALFASALHQLVARQESLRTSFINQDDETFQVVCPQVEFDFKVVDLTLAPAKSRDELTHHLILGSTQKPFDLSTGPLLRLFLVELEPTERILVVTMHHIISDGWSVSVFIREIAALYQALRSGRPAPLHHLPMQYLDFSIQQREWFQGEVLERQIAYWKAALGDDIPTLALPTDHPRPAVQTNRGGSYPFLIPKRELAGIARLESELRVSTFMCLLALFQTLLHRYSGQDAVLVGTPIANRNRPGIEDLIGLFVNTLVLRADFHHTGTFEDFLKQIRERALGAFEHQDIPFEKLVEVLQPERNRSHAPLFQAMFILQNTPFSSLALEDIDLEQMPMERSLAKFDLTLEIQESDEGLYCLFEYNAALFELGTIKQFGRHYRRLLNLLTDDAGLNPCSVSFMSEQESRALLVELNQTETGFPTEATLHALFEQRAVQSPDALALVLTPEWETSGCGTIRLTYGELDRRAQILAALLHRHGVTPESIIGVCLPRSFEMVAAIIAALKMGCAYLPLDPNHPAERSRFLIQDADAHVVFTTHQQAEIFSDITDAQIDPFTLVESPHKHPPMQVQPENGAYVIYTSGSTGRPKGVIGTHRATINRFHWMWGRYPFQSHEICCQKTTLTFLDSLWEIFGPLLQQVPVTLIPDPIAKDVQLLVRALAMNYVTRLVLVPSLLRVILAETRQPAAILSNLRLWVTSGEALPSELLHSFREALPEAVLLNLYGASEVAADVTCYEASLGKPPEQVPIGYPIANCRAYITDDRLQPVPFGVRGQLVVGGEGQARGYVGRPDLTAMSFIPDPFSPLPGARLYRTGDIAWRLQAGLIQYQGRADHQVKLRGFRIELGEIESVLRQHPQVAEAVTLIRGDGELQTLVAFIRLNTPSENATDLTAELDAFLRLQLPEYMVPSRIVVLDEIPHTASGKVNRLALPNLDDTAPQIAHVDPRTPVEQELARIWADLLQREKVSVTGNFFEMGGHSLLATRILSQTRRAFGKEISLAQFFENPTIAAVARLFEPGEESETARQAPAITPAPKDAPSVLSFGQQRMWFLDQLDETHARYNIAAALHITGHLDYIALSRAIERVAHRHHVLQTVFPVRDGSPNPEHRPLNTAALPMIDLSGLAPNVRERLAEDLSHAAARHPFNLADGPLWCVSLLKRSQGHYLFLANMHHIVADAWSMSIFINELSSHYTTLVNDEPLQIAEPTVQYADFAHWQRQWLSGGVLESELAHWRERLHEPLPILQLPGEPAANLSGDHRGGLHAIRINAQLSSRLKLVGAEANASLFMTLLSAWFLLLHRYSRQDDIIVGAPIAGRNRAEIEGLIGCFLNMLALRVTFDGAVTFRNLLQRVAKVTLDAYAHQDMPFEKLVEVLQPDRHLDGHPIFDVLFNFINTPAAALELPGLTFEPAGGTEPESRFNMTLYAREEEHGIALELVYRRARFSAERIACMMDQYHLLLQQIADDTAHDIGGYSLITAEAAALLPDLNEKLDTPHFPTVLETIADLAERYPHRMAITHEAGALDYASLILRARQIAAHLGDQGIQPGDVVAVHGQRTHQLVPTCLGVMLRGAVLLTLDAALPVERRRLMALEAGAKRIINLGDEAQLIEGVPADSLNHPPPEPTSKMDQPGPEDPAYIFFTSGSTGKPKGILGRHKGLAHFMAWQHQVCLPGANERVAQLAGLSFDALLRDILLPLTSGGTLCQPSAEAQLEPTQLITWLESRRISLCHLVPSVAQRLLQAARPTTRLSSLRHVFFVGEPLHDTLVTRWRSTFTNTERVTNLYGTTETTLAKLYYHVPSRPTPGIQPAGGPLPHTHAYVLDEHLNPLGIGELGHILIRTPFRTLGYINAPEDNKRLFIPNPRGNDPHDLLHRTGDLGRYRPDGILEVVGRADDQIKIRGIRVEPAEVENLINRYDDVHQAAVLVQSDEDGEKRLIAFVQWNQAGEPSPTFIEAVRVHLRRHLPEVMVPALLLPIAAMPLTPNGKLDRASLRRIIPAIAHQTRERTFEPPQTATEKAVAAIWADLLNTTRVGRQDDFFALGGHSLLATRVVSRVRSEIGVEIPLRLVFEAPRLCDFAGRTDTSVAQPRESFDFISETETEPPLSFAQRRLWFLDRLEGPSSTYNIPAVLTLHGPLDVRALECTVLAITARHETLRTRFREIDCQPRQVIAPDPLLQLVFVDLSRQEDTTALTDHWIMVENRRPFDLEQDSPLRVTVMRLSSNRHILLVTMHHIISDGWSLGVLVNELAQLYRASIDSQVPHPPALPIQYRHFSDRQQRWFEEGRFDAQLTFWKHQLAGTPDLIALPTDHPRPARQTFRGGYLPFIVPEQLTTELRNTARSHGITLFMLLQSAFSLLLSRYAHQDDIATGTPIANRTHKELEPMIGFFVNTLVLRTDLSGDPNFTALLQRVRDVTLNAYANQDIPFEEVVEALQPQRNLSHSPLFQVMFALQNTPMERLTLPGLDVELMPRDRNTAKFDLNLLLSETDAHIVGDMEICTDLYRLSSIQKMLDHYLILLKAVVSQTDQPISRYSIIDENEKRQLLTAWNADLIDWEGAAPTAHEQVDITAARNPDTIAMTFEDAGSVVHHVSYREMIQRADRIAWALRKRAAGPETVVGLLLERGLDLPLGALAILKSGAAYLPLDPTYPEERLRLMLEEARTDLLLTSKTETIDVSGYETIDITQAMVEHADQSQTPAPTNPSTAQNQAFVIFTSGSTGRPKGITMTHQALRNVTHWQCTVSPPASRTLQFTTISFDMAFLELFATWFSAGTLVNLSESDWRDLNGLPAFVARHRITRLILPYVALQHLAELVETNPDACPDSLKEINVAGEQLRITPAIAKLARQLPALDLRNEYGPAETHVVTAETLPQGNWLSTPLPPIGTPVPNCPIYILDHHLRPTGTGVPGRLYIGGVQLARGYHHRPELTAARFIPDPFSTLPGARLYDSGDLARFDQMGRIIYQGRADQQVKIRGIRIEPGEIEVCLGRLKSVKEAVVHVHGEAGGSSDARILAAYIVPRDPDIDEPEFLDQLRGDLRGKLPAHMIPSVFMVLEELPLTPTGKINRRELPAPLQQAKTQYMAPRDEDEEKMAAIWREVLKIERVGVHDNFFELGGHSLLATRMINRIKHEFGISLPLAEVFESPTIEALTKNVSTLRYFIQGDQGEGEDDDYDYEGEI